MKKKKKRTAGELSNLHAPPHSAGSQTRLDWTGVCVYHVRPISLPLPCHAILSLAPPTCLLRSRCILRPGSYFSCRGDPARATDVALPTAWGQGCTCIGKHIGWAVFFRRLFLFVRQVVVVIRGMRYDRCKFCMGDDPTRWRARSLARSLARSPAAFPRHARPPCRRGVSNPSWKDLGADEPARGNVWYGAMHGK